MANAEGVESSAAEVTGEDLDLLSALDVGEGKGDTSGDKESGKGDKTNGAGGDITAKGKEVGTDDVGDKGDKDDKDEGAGDKEPKWFEETITDKSLRKLAGEFETQDALMEAVGGLQKALGVEPIKDWKKGIEDEKLREHAGRFTSPADVVKRHFELRQKLSSALIPPGKSASKEDKEVFASRLSKMLGVPEKPEDYEFPAPAEGVQLTDDEKKSRGEWAGFFHQIHLPKPMADAILGRFAEETTAGKVAIEQADTRFADESTAKLEAEWGDDYDVNRTAASRAGRELFGDEFDSVMQAELSNGRLLMDSTFMLRALLRIGREMSEGSMDVLTENERETIDDQVKDLRKRANEAKESGDTRLANKIFKQEQELLTKVVGKTPIVGAGGRAI